MKRFRVELLKQYSTYQDINAENEQGALEQVKLLIEEGMIDEFSAEDEGWYVDRIKEISNADKTNAS